MQESDTISCVAKFMPYIMKQSYERCELATINFTMLKMVTYDKGVYIALLFTELLKKVVYMKAAVWKGSPMGWSRLS